MSNVVTLDQWCEALESGKYKQGTGSLRCDDEFCCLGVLADLMEPESWTNIGEGDGEALWRGKYQGTLENLFPFTATIPDDCGDNCTCRPPIDETDDTNVCRVDVQTVLATKNDGGNDFKQIAAWLREHREVLECASV